MTRSVVNNGVRYVEVWAILEANAANRGRSRVAPQNPAVSPSIYNVAPGCQDTDQVEQIYRGEVTAWSQLGGPGLEVTPPNLDTNEPGPLAGIPPRVVVWDQSGDRRNKIMEQESGDGATGPSNSIVVSSPGEFQRAIRNTPGVIGLTWYPVTCEVEHAHRDLREDRLVLGATRIQTIGTVVRPATSPGILPDVILAIGRAVGETAAILYEMSSNLSPLRGLNSPIRVMYVNPYFLIKENISIPNVFATATIRVLIVFLVNQSTTRLIGRLNRQAGR